MGVLCAVPFASMKQRLPSVVEQFHSPAFLIGEDRDGRVLAWDWGRGAEQRDRVDRVFRAGRSGPGKEAALVADVVQSRS